MPSTVTIQSVINYAACHSELMPLANVGGFSNEPALSLVNDTLAAILCPPFGWKHNRKDAPLLVTGLNRQDTKFAGACAFVLDGVGGVGIDLASNNAITESGTTVTVKTLDPHNFAVGQKVYMTGNTVADYNSVETITQSSSVWSGGWVITATPDAKTFVFTHSTAGLATSGAPGITDFGWLEYATMVDENNTASPRAVKDLQASRSLRPNGEVSTPNKVSVIDGGTGILTVRFSHVPGATVWGVTLAYQMKPPVKADLTGTISPIPDEYAFVFRQMFLAAAFRYVGSSKADKEDQKAQMVLAKAIARDDAEQSDEYIAPENSLMGGANMGWW